MLFNDWSVQIGCNSGVTPPSKDQTSRACLGPFLLNYHTQVYSSLWLIVYPLAYTHFKEW